MKLQSVWTFVFALMLVVASSACAQQSAGVLLQSGLYKEDVNGELEAAIEIYERVLKEFPNDRQVAAKALLHIGLCYEKLGKQEAQKAYERLIKEYADQNGEATEARVRLAAMERENGKSEVTIRKVFDDLLCFSGEPSPDGRYLSVVNWETFNLAARDLATGERQDIPDDGQTGDQPNGCAGNSIWSPDGKQIAYRWFHGGRSELRIVGLDSSEPRVVWCHDDPELSLVPLDWSQDGQFIVAGLNKPHGDSEIVLVSVADDSVRTLKSQEGHHLRLHKVSFSPNGRYVVYNRPVKENDGFHGLFLLATDGNGKEVPLVGHLDGNNFDPVWAPDGKAIVFVSDRGPIGTSSLCFMQVVDGKQVGQPQFVVRSIGKIKTLGFTGEGSLYYGVYSDDRRSTLYVGALDANTGEFISQPTPVLSEGSNEEPSWSPDGKKLAYYSRRLSSKGAAYASRYVIVIRSMETGQERELTLDQPILLYYRVRWSPDGRSLLCGGAETRGIHLIDVQTGHVTTIVEEYQKEHGKRFRLWIHSPKWSPDGQKIFYIRNVEKEDWPVSIVAHDLATGEEKELYHGGEMKRYGWLAVSRDGQELAFDDESSTVLKAIPTMGGKTRELFRLGEDAIKENDWLEPIMWTSDGRHLLFEKRRGRDRGREMWRVPTEGGEPGKLWGAEKTGGVRPGIHPNGQRVAFRKGSGSRQRELWVIENFLLQTKVGK